MVLGLGVGDYAWDHHFYPLPGTYDYPSLEWPRPFSRLAQPAHEFAENLRYRKSLRQERKWLSLKGTVWRFETNIPYFESDGFPKGSTSGTIRFDRYNRIKISGEPFLLEIENEEFKTYKRPNLNQMTIYSDTMKLRLELSKVHSRTPAFAGYNSKFSLHFDFFKIEKPKPITP